MTITQDKLTKELNKDPDELFQLGEDWIEDYEKNSDLAYKQQAIKYYKAAAKSHHQLAITRLNELGVKYIPKYEKIDNFFLLNELYQEKNFIWLTKIFYIDYQDRFYCKISKRLEKNSLIDDNVGGSSKFSSLCTELL